MKDIMKEQWDVLIVLDACRYDVFKEVYPYFFIGNLGKYRSVATDTRGWFLKTFHCFYHDVIYISGNPWCNNKGLSSFADVFDGREFFNKVIDVWDWGWDNNINTVPPDAINESFLEWYNMYPNKRYILHYMQPHPPYVGITKNSKDGVSKKTITATSVIANRLYHFYKSYFPMIPFWYLCKLIGINIGVGELYFKEGWKGIREVYTRNLVYALSSIAELIKETDLHYVITSDHGERLGEWGRYGHGGIRDRIVTEIPWFTPQGVII